MKPYWLLAFLLFTTSAHAYSSRELREDCQAAEQFFDTGKSTDPYQSVQSARCISYVAGFADSYAVSDYLAEKVGVKLNAFCLPETPDLSARLVRAVLAQTEHLPPNDNSSPARLVAGAFARSFPCSESLEPKK